MFSNIAPRRPQDKPFVITSPANNGQHVYVQKRQFKGVDDHRTWMSYPDIMRDGELHLDMGPTANTSPRPNEDLPYSASPKN